jgi:hypothetical protein
MPIKPLIKKVMQDVIARINNGCDTFCRSNPNWKQKPTLRKELREFYSHTKGYP